MYFEILNETKINRILPTLVRHAIDADANWIHDKKQTIALNSVHDLRMLLLC